MDRDLVQQALSKIEVGTERKRKFEGDLDALYAKKKTLPGWNTEQLHCTDRNYFKVNANKDIHWHTHTCVNFYFQHTANFM